MTRRSRNTVIQVGIENDYGVNPGSWGPTSSILIKNPRFRVVRDVAPRELVRGYLGGSDQLKSTRRAEIEFEVELAGAGAAGTVPAYGVLLRACGMAETVNAGVNVEYTPVSEGFESLTIRYALDGVIHIAKGCRGSVVFDLNAYGIPMMKFKFQGFDAYRTDAPLPNTDFSAWQTPLVLTDGNAGDIHIGGSFANGWASGGTKLKSRGLTFDLGNKISHLKILGGEEIDIADRQATGKMSVELDPTEEVAWETDMNGNVLTSVGFRFGTTAGQKVSVYAPKVQRITPEAEDYEGRVMFATDLALLPLTGNDELTISVL